MDNDGYYSRHSHPTTFLWAAKICSAINQRRRNLQPNQIRSHHRQIPRQDVSLLEYADLNALAIVAVVVAAYAICTLHLDCASMYDHGCCSDCDCDSPLHQEFLKIFNFSLSIYRVNF